jgi:hypothetical protein
MSAAERHAELRAAFPEEAVEGATTAAGVDCGVAPPPPENCSTAAAVAALAIRPTNTMIPTFFSMSHLSPLLLYLALIVLAESFES